MKKRALFLGRIYPVKGLANFIRAWSHVQPEGWECHIVGPDEAGHRQELTRLVARLRLADQIVFRDAVDGDAKQQEFENADLFVLPSYSESFGMSAVEAMAMALPVIVTTGTPLWQVKGEKLGWYVDPDVEALCGALSDATQRKETELIDMGNRASAWVAQEFSWRHVAARYVEMYEEVLATA